MIYQTILFGIMALIMTQAFAKDLVLTPRQTEGPFYPDKLPSHIDNDLVLIKDSATPATGEVTHLTGRVLGPTGRPVDKAIVEIWQTDGNGVYIHSRSPNQERRDKRFQGIGRFITGPSGEYAFRTVKPRSYFLGVRRAPHIHFIVRKGEERMLTTQMYIKGHPLNDQDICLQGIRDKAAREAVIVEFTPIKDSETDELAARFDIVIGRTPENPEDDMMKNLDGHLLGFDSKSLR